MKKIDKLIELQKYNEVLELIDELEATNGFLTLKHLLLKGRCIQLSENGNYLLKDAEKLYLKILEEDELNQDALIELGWYYIDVEDNANEALPYFQKAFDISKKNLMESFKGQAFCIKELKGYENAIAFIKKNELLDVNLLKIELENQ